MMQMEGVACLGWKKSPGESARSSRKELFENVLSRRGLNKGKGIMVILSMPKHNESDTNRKGSMKQRSERWFHLIWSYGLKVVDVFLPGTYL